MQQDIGQDGAHEGGEQLNPHFLFPVEKTTRLLIIKSQLFLSSGGVKFAYQFRLVKCSRYYRISLLTTCLGFGCHDKQLQKHT